MTLLDFEPDLLVDKDRTRGKRRYVTKTRHANHGHCRESRDRQSEDPINWNRRLLLADLEARELEHPSDPSEFDPYWAYLFPITQEEIDELDRIFNDEMLRDLYLRTGWGPGPTSDIHPADGYDNYYSQYGEHDLVHW